MEKWWRGIQVWSSAGGIAVLFGAEDGGEESRLGAWLAGIAVLLGAEEKRKEEQQGRVNNQSKLERKEKKEDIKRSRGEKRRGGRKRGGRSK